MPRRAIPPNQNRPRCCFTLPPPHHTTALWKKKTMSHEPGHNADTAASDHIECDRHGHAHAAFICQHLLAQPRQHWACEYPTPDQPWPDAWCAECDAAFFLQAGGWDESNEATADIQMVCSSCYNELKAESVLTLDEAELEAWNAGQHASANGWQPDKPR